MRIFTEKSRKTENSGLILAVRKKSRKAEKSRGTEQHSKKGRVESLPMRHFAPLLVMEIFKKVAQIAKKWRMRHFFAFCATLKSPRQKTQKSGAFFPPPRLCENGGFCSDKSTLTCFCRFFFFEFGKYRL